MNNYQVYIVDPTYDVITLDLDKMIENNVVEKSVELNDLKCFLANIFTWKKIQCSNSQYALVINKCVQSKQAYYENMLVPNLNNIDDNIDIVLFRANCVDAYAIRVDSIMKIINNCYPIKCTLNNYFNQKIAKSELRAVMISEPQIAMNVQSIIIKPKKQTIGIYSIFIDVYIKFYENFIKNMEKYFLPHHKKYYFIITDKRDIKRFNDRTFVQFTNKIGHPYETLYRFKYFLKFSRKDMNLCDVIYFINSNALCQQVFNSTVLPINGFSFTTHHGFVNCGYDATFEKEQTTSTACVEYDNTKEKYIYYGGGFYGADRDKFIEMAIILDNNITEDEKNGIIAEWHDESHINHYCNIILNHNFNILGFEYHIPEEKKSSYMNIKLMYLDKDKFLGNDLPKKKCSKITSGKIIINEHNRAFLI